MAANPSATGTLDRDAVTADLRRYLETVIRCAGFDLKFRIESSRTTRELGVQTSSDGVTAGGPAGDGAGAGSAADGAGAGRPADNMDEPEITVIFDGADSELLLAHAADLLKALEFIAVRCLRLDPKLHDRVRFDCANYRADQMAELKLSAKVAAERVLETRLPFRFNPMGARERRIVHLVLKDQPGIRTASEGQGDDRRVVVFPADKNNPSVR